MSLRGFASQLFFTQERSRGTARRRTWMSGTTPRLELRSRSLPWAQCHSFEGELVCALHGKENDSFRDPCEFGSGCVKGSRKKSQDVRGSSSSC